MNLFRLPSDSSTEVSHSSDEPKIELNEEFVEYLDYLEHMDGPLFVTGKAGTGKSTLLRHFVKNSKSNVVVVAPTGIAAVTAEGSTIHSFFRIAPRYYDDPSEVRVDSARYELFSELDILVIDEISMVRSDLLDIIDHLLRYARSNDEPFGGVKVRMFGDPFQLPPVVTEKEIEYFSRRYPNPFFFSSDVISKSNMSVVQLTKVYRQSDPEFVGYLDSIRDKSISVESLGKLNNRCCVPLSYDDRPNYVTLTSTNIAADAENSRIYNSINSEEKSYKATVIGEFKSSSYPTDEILNFKVGTRVMFLKNSDLWCNGTTGEIVELRPNSVKVKLDNGLTHLVGPATWHNIDYKYDRDTGIVAPEVKGVFKQLPLRLAWAVTIHKSQGCTFDRVRVDLGRGAFAAGQTYVALSRCRSLEGLNLVRPILSKDIIPDPEVLRFFGALTTRS